MSGRGVRSAAYRDGRELDRRGNARLRTSEERDLLTLEIIKRNYIERADPSAAFHIGDQDAYINKDLAVFRTRDVTNEAQRLGFALPGQAVRTTLEKVRIKGSQELLFYVVDPEASLVRYACDIGEFNRYYADSEIAKKVRYHFPDLTH